MNPPHAKLVPPATVASPDDDVAGWLDEALAPAGPPSPDTDAQAAAVRGRLQQRLAASRAAEAAMVTARLRRVEAVALAAGVSARTLYAAHPGAVLRPGEPLRVRLIELAAGARLTPAALGGEATLRARHREWLVVAGAVTLGAEVLSARDYHVTPAGHDTPVWSSRHGARLFLRESDAVGGDAPHTVRDADAGWPAFAPGIQRRVLWQHGGQAALLYLAQPGAQVPDHTHGHDEECLMVEGALFLDDVLLQPGDYQLAPAGSGHRVTATDTGVVIYAHGDLDLRFVG